MTAPALPCRQKTNLCAPQLGECLRCLAANGEACREQAMADYHDPSDDDGECSMCGGTGIIEGDCTCMDDTCCCLEPTPPDCPECARYAQLMKRKAIGSHR